MAEINLAKGKASGKAPSDDDAYDDTTEDEADGCTEKGGSRSPLAPHLSGWAPIPTAAATAPSGASAAAPSLDGGSKRARVEAAPAADEGDSSGSDGALRPRSPLPPPAFPLSPVPAQI